MSIKQKEVTSERLNRGFLELGDTLEVHSSLSSMGYVKGGACTLMKVVGRNGTILMSAYPMSKALPLTEEDRKMGILWKVKILEDTTQKTGMGAIVDEFVKRQDTLLGQGNYRVCAWGKEKDNYAEGYAPIYKADGKILLLGVGIDRCSSFHLAEDVPVPQKIEKYFKLSNEILAKYPQSEWAVGIKDPPGDAWGKVFEWADKQNYVKKTRIGRAVCLSFPIKPLIDEYRNLRRDDLLRYNC